MLQYEFRLLRRKVQGAESQNALETVVSYTQSCSLNWDGLKGMFYSLSRSSFHSIRNGNELTFADMQMVFVRTIKKKKPVQLIYSIFANLKGVFFQALLMFLFPWFAIGKNVLAGLRLWCPAKEMDRQCKCCKYAPETKVIIIFFCCMH